jgi:hypothetical protein
MTIKSIRRRKTMAMMKNGNRRRTWLATSLTFILMVGICSIALAQQERSDSQATTDGISLGGSPIVGTWIFNIDDLSAGFSFHSLVSLTDGGVVITSASLPTPAPFYGGWQEAKPGSFNASFYTFTSDANGVAVGTSKVSLILKLTSLNTLAGAGVGSNCDLQGENCIRGDDFQFTGKRVPK